jgi:hypothetical protein
MSDDDGFNFATVIPDKGKSKLRSFEVESSSLSPKDIEIMMMEDAGYIANLFGIDVRPSGLVDDCR